MIPSDVPNLAKQLPPTAQVFQVGPPRGVSADDCGTIEAQVEREAQFGPVWRTYWRPTDHELEQLRAGGHVELALHAPQLVMQAMSVLGPATAEEPAQAEEPQFICDLDHESLPFRYCSTKGCTWTDGSGKQGST